MEGLPRAYLGQCRAVKGIPRSWRVTKGRSTLWKDYEGHERAVVGLGVVTKGRPLSWGLPSPFYSYRGVFYFYRGLLSDLPSAFLSFTERNF